MISLESRFLGKLAMKCNAKRKRLNRIAARKALMGFKDQTIAILKGLPMAAMNQN